MAAARLWLGLAILGVAAAVVAVPLLWRQDTPPGSAGAVLGGLSAVLLAVVAGYRLPEAGIGFELEMRRCFRAVCREKGLVHKAGDAVRYPSAGRLFGGRDGFRLTVRPLLGHSVVDWERAAAAFTMAYGATGTRFRQEPGGTLTMLVGYQKLDAHEFLTTDDHAVPAAGVSWRDRLAYV